MVVYFVFGDVMLCDEDKLLFDDFVKVISQYCFDVVIMVEGFIDLVGLVSYNKCLGFKCVEVVCDYFVSIGGLNVDKICVVSYGEVSNCQVEKGQVCDVGLFNC